MRNIYFWFGFFICAAFFAYSSYAGDGNYQNYLVGERAAGMGGAAVALTDSVEAAFYNPAGLAHTPASTISLSASLYGFYKYDVEDGWYPNEDIDVDSFITIPSTFGSIWKLDEKTAIALSAFIPDRTSSNDLEAFLDDYHFFKYSREDQTLWIGPSAAYRLTPELSLGLSVFFTYRNFSQFRDWYWGDYGGESLSEDIKYTDLSLLMVLGGRYALDDNWSLGLAIQTPSIHLTGDGEFLQKRVVPTLDTTEVYYVDDAETKNQLPTKITAGIAYQIPKKYAAGLDISYHLPTGFNRFEGDDQFGNPWEWRLSREGVVNVNLGGEYYIKERYPLRLGFFTNLSSAPKANVETSAYPPHINKYGISASVGRETEHTTLNLGVNYVWGSGKYVGFKDPYTSEIVDASESYLYIFLASSYIF